MLVRSSGRPGSNLTALLGIPISENANLQMEGAKSI